MNNQEKEKRFCEIYAGFYGEEISMSKQLKHIAFDGDDLMEFVEHVIKFASSNVPVSTEKPFGYVLYGQVFPCMETLKDTYSNKKDFNKAIEVYRSPVSQVTEKKEAKDGFESEIENEIEYYNERVNGEKNTEMGLLCDGKLDMAQILLEKYRKFVPASTEKKEAVDYINRAIKQLMSIETYIGVAGYNGIVSVLTEAKIKISGEPHPVSSLPEKKRLEEITEEHKLELYRVMWPKSKSNPDAKVVDDFLKDWILVFNEDEINYDFGLKTSLLICQYLESKNYQLSKY